MKSVTTLSKADNITTTRTLFTEKDLLADNINAFSLTFDQVKRKGWWQP